MTEGTSIAVAAFKLAANAEKFTKELADNDITATIVPGNNIHVVHVPFEKAQEARDIRDRVFPVQKVPV